MWALKWSPDAQRLAVAIRSQADQSSTIVYRVADGAVLAMLPGNDPTWSFDGRIVATTLCAEGCRTTLTRTDGAPAVVIDGHLPIFSPDSRTIITSLPPGSDSSQVQPSMILWSTQGKRLADLPNTNTSDFNPDGQSIAIAPSANSPITTTIRRSANGAVIRTLSGSLPSYSHDGRLLAVTDGITIWLWNTKDLEAQGGQPVHTFTAPITEAGRYGNALSFSPDDQTLHAVLGHHLYSWRVADGTLLSTIPNAAAEGVSFEAHGAILQLFAAGGDGPSSITLKMSIACSISLPRSACATAWTAGWSCTRPSARISTKASAHRQPPGR